jgi:hypothetical protein
MERKLLKRVDELIEEYKKNHRSEPPFYIIMSPDDGDTLIEEVRRINKQPQDNIVTTYKDSKIVRNPAMLNGTFYVSSELPETGS